MKRSLLILLIAILSIGTPAIAMADNYLGFSVGGATFVMGSDSYCGHKHHHHHHRHMPPPPPRHHKHHHKHYKKHHKKDYREYKKHLKKHHHKDKKHRGHRRH